MELLLSYRFRALNCFPNPVTLRDLCRVIQVMMDGHLPVNVIQEIDVGVTNKRLAVKISYF